MFIVSFPILKTKQAKNESKAVGIINIMSKAKYSSLENVSSIHRNVS